jgi:hypothetical protein
LLMELRRDIGRIGRAERSDLRRIEVDRRIGYRLERRISDTAPPLIEEVMPIVREDRIYL